MARGNRKTIEKLKIGYAAGWLYTLFLCFFSLLEKRLEKTAKAILKKCALSGIIDCVWILHKYFLFFTFYAQIPLLDKPVKANTSDEGEFDECKFE